MSEVRGEVRRERWQELVRREFRNLEEQAVPRTAAGRDEVPSTSPEPLAAVQQPPRDLVGLALSGGGIRSATFNLGLLQALDEFRMLRHFDYLATVSGGGYIGAFWSAWRHRNRSVIAASPDASQFPSVHPGDPLPEHPAVRHLREYSNFLSPRLGLLRYDAGRAIAAVVAGLIPALLACSALLVLGLGIWLLIGNGMFAFAVPNAVSNFAELATGVGFDRQGAARFARWVLPTLTFAVVTLGALLGFEWSWRRGMRRDGRHLGVFLLIAFSASLAAIVTWWWVTTESWHLPYRHDFAAPTLNDLGARPGRLVTVCVDGTACDWSALLRLLLPAGVWMATVAALTITRMGVSFLRPKDRVGRSAHDRVGSRLFFLAVIWTAITAVWTGGIALRFWMERAGDIVQTTGAAGLLAAIAITFERIRAIVKGQPNKPSSGGLLERFRLRSTMVLSYVALSAAVCVLAALIGMSVEREWLRELSALAVAVIVLTILFFNPNEVGLHSFYRARLARAYLGASNEHATRHTEEQRGDDLDLRELGGLRPLPLFCCAANDLSPRDAMASLHRGAVSAVLSPVGFTVGNASVSWEEARERLHGDSPVVTVGTAMTASAAAFNSQMGSRSIELGKAASLLMSALNLRLGVWIAHPDTMRGSGRLQRRLRGLSFYKEVLGISRADGKSVHLSDGGHFENMALYELVRRRCRYILASDCGADPDIAFDDFGNLVRRVREDFGVEIEIDLTPLRPGANGLAAQPMVAGDIHYPDGDVGVLLLIKPTLVGNEPPDIAQYRRRNQAFPHESTGDQFYDEAQWESYRRLGLHAARSALRGLADEKRSDGERPAIAAVFARARRRWIPAPGGFEARHAELAPRLNALDARLCSSEARYTLLRDFPEVELVAHAGVPAPADPGEVQPTPPESLEDAVAAFGIVREALQLMEQVYLSESLGKRHQHPAYLGLLNRFLRWTYSPALRRWWPVLRPIYDQGFVAFAETHLGLAGRAEGESTRFSVAPQSRDPRTYALGRWLMERDAPTVDEPLLHFDIQLGDGEPGGSWLQAGLVQVDLSQPGVMRWNVDDFYIAPGLWGVGLGERFLQRIVQGEGVRPDVRWLVVHQPWADLTSAAARRSRAYLTQMHRAQGFREIDVENLYASDALFEVIKGAASSHARGAPWMMREVVRPSPAPSHGTHSDAATPPAAPAPLDGREATTAPGA